MTRVFGVVCAFACLISLADAGPEPAPPTVEEAADRVQAAVAADDTAALKALAHVSGPNPWKVAEALCVRGQHDAAVAFAKTLLGTAHWHPAHAQAVFEKRLAAARKTGDPQAIARSEVDLAALLNTRGSLPAARKLFDRALPTLEAAGASRELAEALSNAGVTYARLGHYERASGLWKRAHDLQESLGDARGAASTCMRIGGLEQLAGNHREALRILENALARVRKEGLAELECSVLGNIGTSYRALGNFPKALRTYKQALALARELPNVLAMAATLTNIGAVYHALGDYPAALEHLEAAEKLSAEIGDVAGAAEALTRLSTVMTGLGDHEKALRYQQRALINHQKSGNQAEVIETRTTMGQTLAALGELEDAASELKEALSLARQIGRPYAIAKALNRLGEVQVRLGNPTAALAGYEEARSLYEQIQDRQGVLATVTRMGWAQHAAGKSEQALKTLADGAREARRLREAAMEVEMAKMAARIHLERGEASEALTNARRALREIEDLLGGLDEGGSASARAANAALFEIGTLAAIRSNEAADALWFLESGRAGALLETLDARQHQTYDDLPQALRDAERDARQALARAQATYDAARESGVRKEIRKANRALHAARDAVRGVAARIQREAKKQAGLFYPRAATQREIQEHLAEGEVLVVYGLCRDEAVAFVLAPKSARILSLGSRQDVQNACKAADSSTAQTQPKQALQTLRTLLVAPLQLPKSTKRVLVSPEGPLCYVPFGALFDVPVAVTPSGTTHVLLRDEVREAGHGVLALGDPDYAGKAEGSAAVYHRGRLLAALPATRAEVAQVGTHTLLGPEATEAKLREAVTQRDRWRAIHLACHGLIDPERPTLSALALSRPTASDDGLLTVLDVLRMKLPADLAVLSACETGTGKLAKGEGIVGLTRAFMYAGAPRVLCSLWKVDDAATQALMLKFYELWNPKEGEGLPAAAALRKAQQHVKSQEKWAHPYYWAAWLLWGLPD